MLMPRKNPSGISWTAPRMSEHHIDEACAICSPISARAPSGDVVTATTKTGRRVVVRIGRTLGAGGVGVVHEGRMDQVHTGEGEVDGCAVAVKILRRELTGDAGVVSRFAREIEHALAIVHPHVVAAIASGALADGRPFLVMERLAGSTLAELVRVEGPLGLGRGLRLGGEVLAGLEAIHRAGLVHRDLSPDNVFVVRDARGERAVILDLGFAQAPGVDVGDGATVDSRGSLVGTLAFMAPEQATRARAITAKSDLFVAALLVYFALSGRLPFTGRDERDALLSVVRAAPAPLRRVRRGVPAGLDAVLARALAKHPDARFAGAGDMRDALLATAPAALSAPARPARVIAVKAMSAA